MGLISKQVAIDMLLSCAKAVTIVDNYLFSSSEVKLANIELTKLVMLLEEERKKSDVKQLVLELVDTLQSEFLKYNDNVTRLEIVLKTLQETKDAVEEVLMSYSSISFETPYCMSVQYLITAIGYYKLERQRCLDRASGEFVKKPNMQAGNYVK